LNLSRARGHMKSYTDRDRIRGRSGDRLQWEGEDPKESIVTDLTGKSAVPFELRDSTGRIHRLETYRGKWLLLVFHRHLG